MTPGRRPHPSVQPFPGGQHGDPLAVFLERIALVEGQHKQLAFAPADAGEPGRGLQTAQFALAILRREVGTNLARRLRRDVERHVVVQQTAV